MVSGGAGHHFNMSGISLVVKYASTSLCACTHTAAIVIMAIVINFFIISFTVLPFICFTFLKLNLETGLEDSCMIVLKTTAIGYLRVRSTHTPNHILIRIEVVAECPVVQVAAIDASTGI